MDSDMWSSFLQHGVVGSGGPSRPWAGVRAVTPATPVPACPPSGPGARVERLMCTLASRARSGTAVPTTGLTAHPAVQERAYLGPPTVLSSWGGRMQASVSRLVEPSFRQIGRASWRERGSILVDEACLRLRLEGAE